MGKETDEANIR